MRLLEFPCGWRSGWLEKATPKSKPTVEMEETRPAEAAVCASPEKRRRRASRREDSQWQPSLVAISEDGILVPAPPPALAAAVVSKGRGSGKPKAKPKPKPKPKPATRVASRVAKDDYRHYGVVPTFAPAAFFF
ncbi:RNA polymerase II degradation factor 1 [Musa acuminata AAA Group]|uniref:RNA polymerase II degradation factor 1 n=1 Tax=Musa acuminata AAA Group TaxID=214697 RepID=UPI0031D7B488